MDEEGGWWRSGGIVDVEGRGGCGGRVDVERRWLRREGGGCGRSVDVEGG